LAKPFSGPPVPENILAAMKVASFYQQGWLRVLDGAQVKKWLAETESAESELARDEILRKRSEFAGRAATFGWPAGKGKAPVPAPPPPPKSKRARRSGVTGQFLSLSTRGDRPMDWLRAGRALQCALLTAARYDIAVSFLPKPLELTDLKADRRQVRADRKWPWRWLFTEVPQMVLQVATADVDDLGEPWAWGFPEVWDARMEPARLVQPPPLLKPAEPPKVPAA
jgi:hypothetical protein